MLSVMSVLAFVVMVGGLIGMYFTGVLFTASPIVIAFQLLGLALMLWARITFGRRSFHAAASPTAGGIVRTGPYRFIRHPIYTAVLLFAWPAALFYRSAGAVGFAALVSAGALVRMWCEEQLLVRQYPDYAAYARTTMRMIPYVF